MPQKVVNLRQLEQRNVFLMASRKLTRDNDPPLKTVHPTQIDLARYGLGDAYKGGFGSGTSMSKEVSDGMEDGPGRVQSRLEVWCD